MNGCRRAITLTVAAGFFLLLAVKVAIGFSLDHHPTRKAGSIDVKSACFSIGKPVWQSKRRWIFKKTKRTFDGNYTFSYKYNELDLGNASSNTTTLVMLVHPIGVGIGRWYYDRLLSSLANRSFSERYVFLAPDLLASGSACDPDVTYTNADDEEKSERRVSCKVDTLPMLDVMDWSDQILALMTDYEFTVQNNSNIRWCIVSNGGCVPIALEVASRLVVTAGRSTSYQNLTNVVLSSTPSLPGLLVSPDHQKVEKSYRTLCGVLGRLFWWYALRSNGAFIQKFSVKNLAANAENLGDSWTPNCVATAKAFNGQSRYSTFAFLAGALKSNCQARFDILKDSPVKVDIISGGDRRQKSAKSWFWEERRAKSTKAGIDDERPKPLNAEVLSAFLAKNGNRGKRIVIGGRICLAHEDSSGYANALLQLIGDD